MIRIGIFFVALLLPAGLAFAAEPYRPGSIPFARFDVGSLVRGDEELELPEKQILHLSGIEIRLIVAKLLPSAEEPRPALELGSGPWDGNRVAPLATLHLASLRLDVIAELESERPGLPGEVHDSLGLVLDDASIWRRLGLGLEDLGFEGLRPVVRVGSRQDARSLGEGGESAYVELEVTPGLPFKLGRVPLSVEMPATLGVSLGQGTLPDGRSRGDGTFGYVDVGVDVTVPFKVRRQQWAFGVGIHLRGLRYDRQPDPGEIHGTFMLALRIRL
jgi:hypothetical protein